MHLPVARILRRGGQGLAPLRRVPRAHGRGTRTSMGYLYDADRSDLHSDEGPPLGRVFTAHWPLLRTEIQAWLLRWN